MKKFMLISISVLICGLLGMTSCSKDDYPTVKTNDATNVTSTSATLNGEITDDGDCAIFAQGFWLSQFEDFHTHKDVYAYTSTMEFSASVDTLQPGTTYFFKAYASNEVGVRYGDKKSFKTAEANNSNE